MPALGPSSMKNNRSPLLTKHGNVQSNGLLYPIKKQNGEQNEDVNTKSFENKEGREEAEFIKGKKCIKCGYSSVKVAKI